MKSIHSNFRSVVFDDCNLSNNSESTPLNSTGSTLLFNRYNTHQSQTSSLQTKNMATRSFFSGVYLRKDENNTATLYVTSSVRRIINKKNQYHMNRKMNRLKILSPSTQRTSWDCILPPGPYLGKVHFVVNGNTCSIEFVPGKPILNKSGISRIRVNFK